jgi:2-dehydro-3-deoxyphosphogluconate aldolase/(4S)-4-hydroxy-2-oxoglutarate aldolase
MPVTERADRPFSAAGQRALASIREDGVLAVLRAPDGSGLGPAADVLVGEGIKAVEFALTTSGALTALERYCSRAPAQASAGAGTVLTAADAQAAVSAGACYLVTPAVLPEVIEAGAALGVPVIVGALTPTEILTAHRAGAALVKVFPAALGGPGYVRQVRDPLPDVPLVPTGGIAIGEVPAYLAAGAVAAGLGGQLLGDALRGGDLRELAKRAAALVRAIAATDRP